MEISYWHAFNNGRASQSLFKCVTTISGAMGLFNSELMKKVILGYARQTFLCKVKCIFGEDRHITSGIIENDSAVIYDGQAFAQTESPEEFHALLIQQGRWYKGFYRECLVFLPKIFRYSWWSVLFLVYSYVIPFLVIINLAVIITRIDRIVYFIIYVFIMTLLMSMRAIVRNCKFRFIHSLWHPLFFFMFLLPLKIKAFLTCLTPDTSRAKKDRWKKLWPVYAWMVFGTLALIGMGIIFNLVRDKERVNNWMGFSMIIVLTCLSLLFIHWITWGIGVFVPDNKKKLQKMYYSPDNPISLGSVNPDSLKNLKGPSTETL